MPTEFHPYDKIFPPARPQQFAIQQTYEMPASYVFHIQFSRLPRQPTFRAPPSLPASLRPSRSFCCQTKTARGRPTKFYLYDKISPSATPRRAPASLPDKPERLRYPIHPPHHHTTARTIVIRAPPSSPPAATPYAARDRHVVQVSRTRNLKRTGGRRRAGRKECNCSAVRCKFAMQQNCITTTLVVPKGGGAREENCGLRTLSWFPPLQRQARRAKKMRTHGNASAFVITHNGRLGYLPLRRYFAFSA